MPESTSSGVVPQETEQEKAAAVATVLQAESISVSSQERVSIVAEAKNETKAKAAVVNIAAAVDDSLQSSQRINSEETLSKPATTTSENDQQDQSEVLSCEVRAEIHEKMRFLMVCARSMDNWNEESSTAATFGLFYLSPSPICWFLVILVHRIVGMGLHHSLLGSVLDSFKFACHLFDEWLPRILYTLLDPPALDLVLLVLRIVGSMFHVPDIQTNFAYGVEIFFLTFNLTTVSSYSIPTVLNIAPSACLAMSNTCWLNGNWASTDVLAAGDDAIMDGVVVFSVTPVRAPPLFHYVADTIIFGAFHAAIQSIPVNSLSY